MAFTLEYPVGAPTLSVVLRNPEFGNLERVDMSQTQNVTRAGERHCVRDSIWPTVETFVYQFATLTRSKVTEVRDFFVQTAGLEIQINTDHLGQLIHGIIISPVNDIVTQRDDCSYDVGFEVVGTIQ
jgi:hypothetical protein